jgi:hypothetical protein
VRVRFELHRVPSGTALLLFSVKKLYIITCIILLMRILSYDVITFNLLMRALIYDIIILNFLICAMYDYVFTPWFVLYYVCHV